MTKKIMLIGRTSCGKTTFCQALHNLDICYKKTQSVELIDNTIDTPGEYIENRSLYRALIVTSVDADLIILIQDCTGHECIFAPSFSTMFNGKPVVGIVSKIDNIENEEHILQAEEKLELAGVEKIFRVSSIKNIGIEEVREYLSSL
jgi:ethanolamine utilization protein EutP